MRIARIVLLLVAATLAAVAPAATASAAPPGPWEPYRTEPFELPAGARCPFGLRGDVLLDRERIRTLTEHPDGSPHLQEIIGPLMMRFTNTDTGRSVVRNLTGTALLDNGSDGSFTLYLVGGHMAVGLAATDPGGPAFLVFTGSRHAVVFGADGSRTPIYGHGPVENLCATLAG
jgi:hypothetical protein